MDWEEIYTWLEQKSGVSYNFNEDIQEISGDVIFTDTFFWATKIDFILDDLDDALEVIDEHRREIIDTMPTYTHLKKGLINDTVTKITNVINSIKKTLGLEIIPIHDEEDILTNAITLRDLVSIMKSFSLEDIQKRNWFDTYNENFDEVLSELFNIHKNDLVDIHQTIETIMESLDDDDDDSFEDMDEDDE